MCSREQALWAVRSVGAEVVGTLPGVARIGRAGGFGLRDLECPDLTGDRRREMLVELAGPRFDPWAVFLADAGLWRLLFARPDQRLLSVEAGGAVVDEVHPGYGLDGRRTRSPRRVRFGFGSSGSVEYRRPGGARPVVAVDRIGALPATGGPAAAVRVFGLPTRPPRPEGRGCRILWSDLGLSLAFRGVRARSSCRRGRLVEARVGGDAGALFGWRTARGLELGASAGTLGHHHPRAPRAATGMVPLSFPGRPAAGGLLRPTLEARLAGGGVRELRMRPPPPAG